MPVDTLSENMTFKKVVEIRACNPELAPDFLLVLGSECKGDIDADGSLDGFIRHKLQELILQDRLGLRHFLLLKEMNVSVNYSSAFLLGCACWRFNREIDGFYQFRLHGAPPQNSNGN